MSPRAVDLAEILRQAILTGEIPPGGAVPPVRQLATEHGMATATVQAAITQLRNEGLVETVQGSGIVVPDRTVVEIRLSRYVPVVKPDSTRGPWQTACHRQGLDGWLRAISVADIPAAKAPDVAEHLGLGPDDRLICRDREAGVRDPYTGRDKVLQLQSAYYPATLAQGTVLAGEQTVRGGSYAALVRMGIVPTSVDEYVGARPPEHAEAATLGLFGGAILTTLRVTRDEAGAPIEVVTTVSNPHRVRLMYDGLPLVAG